MQVIERYINAKKEQRDFYLAFFLCFAAIISYFESFIPKPIPGIKLGLANSIVVIFVYYNLYKQAFFISIGKVFVVSLFSGNLFSITFIFGLSGALLSAIGMCFIKLIAKKSIGVIGISLIGAFFHISAQLILAFFLLPGMREGIFFISGILLLASFIAGIITGLFAIYVINRL